MTDDSLARHCQVLALHDMLWDIFTGIMEPQLAIWTDIECCLFKRTFDVSAFYDHSDYLFNNW